MLIEYYRFAAIAVLTPGLGIARRGLLAVVNDAAWNANADAGAVRGPGFDGEVTSDEAHALLHAD